MSCALIQGLSITITHKSIILPDTHLEIIIFALSLILRNRLQLTILSITLAPATYLLVKRISNSIYASFKHLQVAYVRDEVVRC